VARTAQDEKLPKLRQAVAQPLAVTLSHANHRRGHRDELVGLDLDERRGLGLTDAGRGEEKRRGDAEHRGKTREDGGARLLDAARLELRDRGARDADATRELGLSEVQSLAPGADRERQRRP
jgi:hypothetical protein